VLSSLEAQLLLGLAVFALKAKSNLLRRLGLLVEDGLGLATKTLLLRVVASLTLSEVGRLACFILGHLVERVLPALLALAVSLSLLRNVNHFSYLFSDR